MSNPKITIALPDSLLYDIRDIRSKTERIGHIGRTLAIFKVREVLFYRSANLSNEDSRKQRRIIKNLLGYMECPQYLRRSLYKVHRDLEWAGILPPLATPHHMVEDKLSEGQFREAVVWTSENFHTYANVGSKHPVRVIDPPQDEIKDNKVRVSTKIVKDPDTGGFRARIVPLSQVRKKVYWGFTIKFTDVQLNKFVNRKKEYYILGTSRHGKKYESIEIPKEDLKKKSLMLLFGEPKQGLYDMMKAYSNVELKDICDEVINTIPVSGTRSIRLEEALSISLARLDHFVET